MSQLPAQTPIPPTVSKTRAVIAPNAKVRLLVYRMAGDHPLVMFKLDVSAARDVVYKKRGKNKLLGFELDLQRICFVAKVGIWMGWRSEPRAYLWYDIDKSESVLMTFNGKNRYVEMHKPTDTTLEFIPSETLGEIKFHEMYGQVARAHMKQQNPLGVMVIVLLLVAAFAGFFAGVALGPQIVHTATTATTTIPPPTNSTTTHTIISAVFDLIRGFLQ